jgi:hypothetical protein
MNATSSDVLALAQTPTASANSEALPRSVYLAVAGLACLPIGLLWDISHHSTIGRDTFGRRPTSSFSLGALCPPSCSLRCPEDYFSRHSGRAQRLGFVLGISSAARKVWVTVWGAMAMMTSAPFDDWWHNRYGLDVKIVSPPHAVGARNVRSRNGRVAVRVFLAKPVEQRERAAAGCSARSPSA